MVEFLNPPIGMSVSQYIDLVKLRKVCNSCIGFCISLRKLFYRDDGILLWFSLQVGDCRSLVGSSIVVLFFCVCVFE